MQQENQSVESTANTAERRAASRFPIERDVRYKVLNKKSNNEAGGGKTINMSSNGILFSADHVLQPGRTLEIAVSWPARLNNQTPLKLVARGRVVRFEDGKAAIEIRHYEFRTSGSQGLALVRPS
jgi:hypothetical protein